MSNIIASGLNAIINAGLGSILIVAFFLIILQVAGFNAIGSAIALIVFFANNLIFVQIIVVLVLALLAFSIFKSSVANMSHHHRR